LWTFGPVLGWLRRREAEVMPFDGTPRPQASTEKFARGGVQPPHGAALHSKKCDFFPLRHARMRTARSLPVQTQDEARDRGMKPPPIGSSVEADDLFVVWDWLKTFIVGNALSC
jgi:hypothetical protein